MHRLLAQSLPACHWQIINRKRYPTVVLPDVREERRAKGGLRCKPMSNRPEPVPGNRLGFYGEGANVMTNRLHIRIAGSFAFLLLVVLGASLTVTDAILSSRAHKDIDKSLEAG